MPLLIIVVIYEQPEDIDPVLNNCFGLPGFISQLVTIRMYNLSAVPAPLDLPRALHTYSFPIDTFNWNFVISALICLFMLWIRYCLVRSTRDYQGQFYMPRNRKYRFLHLFCCWIQDVRIWCKVHTLIDAHQARAQITVKTFMSFQWRKFPITKFENNMWHVITSSSPQR